MSFVSLAANLHNLGRRITGISTDARILFIMRQKTVEEKGSITDGFFIKQKKTKEGEIYLVLRFPNTAENLALFNSSNIIVPKNYNQIYDDLIFDLNKTYFAPSSLAYIEQRINPTGNRYVPAP